MESSWNNFNSLIAYQVLQLVENEAIIVAQTDVEEVNIPKWWNSTIYTNMFTECWSWISKTNWKIKYVGIEYIRNYCQCIWNNWLGYKGGLASNTKMAS